MLDLVDFGVKGSGPDFSRADIGGLLNGKAAKTIGRTNRP